MRIHRLCALLLLVASPVFCWQGKTAQTHDLASPDTTNATATPLKIVLGPKLSSPMQDSPGEEDHKRGADLYQKGLYREAIAAFKTGCDNLSAKACTDLGVMYRRGQGVKRDYAVAAELYLEGCNGGNTVGCNNLGMMYWNNFLPKDDRRAAELFQRSCDDGDRGGCRALAFLYENGQGVKKDLNRAALLYQKAREHQIPFTVKDRLIVIETTVNGAHAKLIVDSGGTTVLGMKFLRAPPVGPPTETLDSLHGSSAVYPITVVWTLDGKEKQMRAVAGDLNFPNNCDGILGADTLETFKSARFDFQTSVLIVEDSEVAEVVAGGDVLGTGHAK